ncbi:gliding motility-associated C-terminal domain-containing protein [Flavobacterium sp.]|uniref:T9SS type B sorting domain-containing protein n=1 Tax=Flavobacterium sp. TaxID=239 RepID=UPI0039E43D0C
MVRTFYILLGVLLMIAPSGFSQDVSLYHQFYGKYDFTFVGNTLNPAPNGGCPSSILTASSASLNLPAGNTIESAYLYWAGSGTGDFNVKLNGQTINASRTFGVIQTFSGMPHFSAFADVTALVQATGNGVYNFSDLDLTAIIPNYCSFGGNFGGWVIVVVYGNDSLPINQLNVYDGLQGMPDFINITLDNLNVVDPQGAQIGMVAWEGDDYNLVNETLRINGNILSNLPLNPANNAFNGTNSFTGSSTLYNMDLDFYNIENYVHAGDTSAEVQLTSGFDFVMVSTVVTKINSQLPDAVIAAVQSPVSCDARQIGLDYTVSNIGTNPLPAGTLVTINAGNVPLLTTQTTAEILPGASESHTVSIDIPNSIPDDFELFFAVDQNAAGQGTVTELDENNNTFSIAITLLSTPKFNLLPGITGCHTGREGTTFDFSDYEQLAKQDPDDVVHFFTSQQDAENNTNPIENSAAYTTAESPQIIYVRLENPNCYALTSFALISKRCPPTVHNFISANEDGKNDDFFIEGLRDIFTHFELSIYNRWGRLVWSGNNNMPNWDGRNNEGPEILDGLASDGTYFYILELNDPEYPKPLHGYLYYKQ